MASFMEYLIPEYGQYKNRQRFEETLNALRKNILGNQSIQTTIGGGLVATGQPMALPASPQTEQLLTLLGSQSPEMQKTGLEALSASIAEQQKTQAMTDQQSAIQQQLDLARSQLSSPSQETNVLFELMKIPGLAEKVAPGIVSQLDPFTLSPDQARFTGTGAEIAKGLQKSEDLQKERERIFDQSTTLRNQYVNISKPFSLQNEAYGRVIASASDPSPAGDLALIFNYMKVLDPGSTVREGEFAQVGAAGGLPTQVQRIFNQWKSGEKLTEEQRADVVNRAGKLFQQAADQHRITMKSYEEIARRNKLPIADVLPQQQTIEVQKAIPPPPPGFKITP